MSDQNIEALLARLRSHPFDEQTLHVLGDAAEEVGLGDVAEWARMCSGGRGKRALDAIIGWRRHALKLIEGSGAQRVLDSMYMTVDRMKLPDRPARPREFSVPEFKRRFEKMTMSMVEKLCEPTDARRFSNVIAGIWHAMSSFGSEPHVVVSSGGARASIDLKPGTGHSVVADYGGETPTSVGVLTPESIIVPIRDLYEHVRDTVQTSSMGDVFGGRR